MFILLLINFFFLIILTNKAIKQYRVISSCSKNHIYNFLVPKTKSSTSQVVLIKKVISCIHRIINTSSIMSSPVFYQLWIFTIFRSTRSSWRFLTSKHLKKNPCISLSWLRPIDSLVTHTSWIYQREFWEGLFLDWIVRELSPIQANPQTLKLLKTYIVWNTIIFSTFFFNSWTCFLISLWK